MQVKTVLNRVHKVKGFVYEQIRFVRDVIEVDVRPRRGSRPYCAGCGDGGRRTTILHGGVLPLYRCGESACFCFTRCVGSTAHAAASRSRWCPGQRASII